MSAGREGKSKGEFSREGKSFRLLVEGTGGEEEWLKDFQAVVDCTGTYGQGRWGFSPFNVLDYCLLGNILVKQVHTSSSRVIKAAALQYSALPRSYSEFFSLTEYEETFRASIHFTFENTLFSAMSKTYSNVFNSMLNGELEKANESAKNMV